jgi:hypothetical protein
MAAIQAAVAASLRLQMQRGGMSVGSSRSDCPAAPGRQLGAGVCGSGAAEAPKRSTTPVAPVPVNRRGAASASGIAAWTGWGCSGVSSSSQASAPSREAKAKDCWT